MATSTKQQGSARKSKTAEEQNEFDIGSEDIVPPFCDPCCNEGSHGTDIPAEGYCKTCGEYLCNQCYSIHCKPKPLRHHVLLDSKNMPRKKAVVVDNDDCLEKCKQHKDMPLKVYCRTHDTVGCIMCLTTNHNTCRCVSFIHDAAKDISKSEEFQEFIDELKWLMTSFNAQLDAAESEVKTITEVHSALKRSDIIKVITELLEEARKMYKNIEESKDNAKRMLNEATSGCKSSLSELRHGFSSKSDILTFLQMKRGQANLSKMKKCLFKLELDIKQSKDGLKEMKTSLKHSQEKITECNHHIQTSLYPLSISEDHQVTKDPQKEEQTNLCGNIDLVSVHTCNITAQDDSDGSYVENSACRITGLDVLSDGRVALADFDNRMVKIFSPRANRVEAIFHFDGKPFDVAEIDENCIVVTVPSLRLISHLTVDGIKLLYNMELETNGSCYGICTDKKVLFVAMDNPPKVEIIDMDGNVLRSVVQDSVGEYIFSSPWYIAYKHVNKSIYVTDRNQDSVTWLTLDGDIEDIRTAFALIRPYGIAVDAAGIVYVCARRTNKIFCFTPDFHCLAEIHTGLSLYKPEAIACWNKRDRLYVGLYENDFMTALDINKT